MEKIAALLLAACLTVGTLAAQPLAQPAETAAAYQPAETSDTVAPGPVPCRDCGDGTCVVTGQIASSWTVRNYDPCIYNPSRMDRTEGRVVIFTYECESCHLGFSDVRQESREMCFHRT